MQCSVLVSIAIITSIGREVHVLQSAAECCRMLQSVAVCSSV